MNRGKCEELVAFTRLEEHKKTCAARVCNCCFKLCARSLQTAKNAIDHLNDAQIGEMWANLDQFFQVEIVRYVKPSHFELNYSINCGILA